MLLAKCSPGCAPPNAPCKTLVPGLCSSYLFTINGNSGESRMGSPDLVWTALKGEQKGRVKGVVVDDGRGDG